DDLIVVVGSGALQYRKYKNFLALPILSFEDYVGVFKTGDVILNPISEDMPKFRGLPMKDFINCKSEIKYVTTGVCKIPFISSKSYRYERAIENEKNGIILDNDIVKWVKAIKKIKQDKEFSDKLVKNAYEDVIQNYTLNVAAHNFLKMYESHFNSLKTYKDFGVPKPIIVEATPVAPLLQAPIKIPKKLEKNKVLDINQFKSTSTLGEIFSNRVINQKIHSNFSDLCKVELKAATYARSSNRGEILICIMEKLNDYSTILRSVTVELAALKDNSWFSINFKPIKESENKDYYVQIKGIGCNLGSSVTLYFSPEERNMGELLINKNRLKGCLSIRTYASK
ncbi:glycosyltransferase, partial [bacterium]|nr:glycosyltransferase [bacterium]